MDEGAAQHRLRMPTRTAGHLHHQGPVGHRRRSRIPTRRTAGAGLPDPHRVPGPQGSGRKPQKTVEVVYLLCPLGIVDAQTQALASWAQAPWTIGVSLHWVRDVTFNEDASRVRTGAGTQTMATLWSTAISLLCLDGYAGITMARGFHRQDPGRASLLVVTAHERL